jgi:predicted permease
MTPILNVVLPVFAIMLAGYLAGRFGLLGEASGEALNRFVYFVALPALFFISMSRVPVAEAFHGPFLIAFGGGMAATFALSLLLAVFAFPNRPAALGLHGLSAVFSNTGYLGIPLLMITYGEAAMLPGVISTVLNGAVVMALGIAMVELDLGRGAGPLRALGDAAMGVLKSPLVLSAASGLAVSALDLEAPAFLATFCDLLAAAVGPCALFAIGLFMVGRSPAAGALEVAWMVLLKLVVQPFVTWWLAYRVLDMGPVWAASAVILAALPTGALVFVLAQQYEIFVQRSTAAIMVSTVLSVLTLSALFVVLGIG